MTLQKLKRHPSRNGLKPLKRLWLQKVKKSIDYRFEQFIQAVHRLYRFMQNKPVHIWMLFLREEQGVVEALKLKWRQHIEMREKLSEIIRTHGLHHSRRVDLVKRSFGCERI